MSSRYVAGVVRLASYIFYLGATPSERARAADGSNATPKPSIEVPYRRLCLALPRLSLLRRAVRPQRARGALSVVCLQRGQVIADVQRWRENAGVAHRPLVSRARPCKDRADRRVSGPRGQDQSAILAEVATPRCLFARLLRRDARA